MVDWLLNGTSTQKGQFVPTAGERNRLSRLRMANEIQCILTYVTRWQCNTVHSKTLQLHKRNNRLSIRMTYLPIITSAHLPIPSQTRHTLFEIISLGVDAILCHDQDTCKTIHTCSRSKMPQDNSYFPMTVFKATVCASTGNNWYNCAPTRWGIRIAIDCVSGLTFKLLVPNQS